MDSSSSDDEDISKFAAVALSGDDIIKGASKKDKWVSERKIFEHINDYRDQLSSIMFMVLNYN